MALTKEFLPTIIRSVKLISTSLLFLATTLVPLVNAGTPGPSYDQQTGRIISYEYPDGTRETYGYDGEGEMITFVDRTGAVTHIKYLADGTVEKVLPDGTIQQIGK